MYIDDLYDDEYLDDVNSRMAAMYERANRGDVEAALFCGD